MGYILAALFMVVAIVALAAYGGTPHGGPTVTCGPISLFGRAFTIGADCRYVSVGELVAGMVCFFLAVISAVTAIRR